MTPPVKELLKLMELITDPQRLAVSSLIARDQAHAAIRGHADVVETMIVKRFKRTIRSKAKLLLHGMKSLCYDDPAAFNSEAFGNQEDHHGLPLACGDNIQTDCVGS